MLALERLAANFYVMSQWRACLRISSSLCKMSQSMNAKLCLDQAMPRKTCLGACLRTQRESITRYNQGCTLIFGGSCLKTRVCIKAPVHCLQVQRVQALPHAARRHPDEATIEVLAPLRERQSGLAEGPGTSSSLLRTGMLRIQLWLLHSRGGHGVGQHVLGVRVLEAIATLNHATMRIGWMNVD